MFKIAVALNSISIKNVCINLIRNRAESNYSLKTTNYIMYNRYTEKNVLHESLFNIIQLKINTWLIE